MSNKGMNDLKDSIVAFLELFVGMFKQLFSLYRQLSDLKNQVIAAALGIDPIVVSIVSYIVIACPIAIFVFKKIVKKT